MTVRRPEWIESDNLSDAWEATLRALLVRGVERLSPMIVVVGGFDAHGMPHERTETRVAIEADLAQRRFSAMETVANTIFPLSLARRSTSLADLCERYKTMLPRLKRTPQNRNGTYFERIIAYNGVNQLEHVVATFVRGNHRGSALQLAIFDPTKDHTHNRRRGFPCLQQVGFGVDGDHGLTITGFYATQDVVAKSYGNYLGLCRLGHYVAQQIGRRLTRMTCIAAGGRLGDVSKESLEPLIATLNALPR